MHIAIIEADQPREPLNTQFGRYANLFSQWLSPALPEAKFTPIAAFEMASLPEPQQFDGILVTGSRYGVYDKLPWMEPLKQMIRQAKDNGVAIGGICFGHQIMAEAFGGSVQKSDQGWVLGRESYVNPADQRAKSVFAIHQDQVVAIPDAVQSVHSSARVPYGRLEYAFPALSVQYHPEFHTEFFHALMRALEGGVLDSNQVEQAIASTEHGTDAAVLAQDFAAFFRR